MPQAIHIEKPAANALLVVGATTTVFGSVTGKGMPEPTAVDGVTVQMGGQPPVPATVIAVPAHLPHPPGWAPSWTFRADVPAPGPPGPLAVIVKATFDSGQTIDARVDVVASPAVATAGKQPQRLLEVRFPNPGGFEPGDDWAPRIAGGEFPVHSGLEWKQVLDSDNEYDQLNPVAATGWAINPRVSGSDMPFNHPFGGDWEFDFALDPQYTFLLAKGNSQVKGDNDAANSSAIARDNGVLPEGGLLQVEWDSGLVPRLFQAQVNTLARVAVLGRWIVDCGHSDPYRSEIHPPLLMASASLYNEPDGVPFTRAVFTSRPYLVGQTFSVDTADIYDDSAADDGHFLEHITREIGKVETVIGSRKVEAHPKIKSRPFMGTHAVEMVVRNPTPSPDTTAHLHDLAVSFHFTVRGGCAVQVVPNDDSSVRVLVALNSVGYTPPALPHRTSQNHSLGELSDLSSKAEIGIGIIEAINLVVNLPAAAILATGVETDKYDPLPAIDLFESHNMVANAPLDNIPGGAGISHDDGQPYPLFGWLDIKWARSELGVHGTP